MKSMLFMLPTIPATYEERERLRPIGRNNERTQRMLDQVREIAVFADQAGFDALALTEHHFHSEGLEMSVAPMIFLADLAARTRRIKLATLVMPLTGWDPIRLAEEIALLDHLTQGRFIPGIGRGYQDRWLNVLGQKYGVAGATSDGSDSDRQNREVFEELYAVMKMAWTEDSIRFEGKYYQVPADSGAGRPRWPVAKTWTARYGAPGEVDAAGDIQRICVVPKPYSEPYPQLWQAFSGGQETIAWCARENIVCWSLAEPNTFLALCQGYRDAARQHGRTPRLGENIGTFRMVYIADTYAAAFALGAAALGDAFVRYFSGFGFFEGFRRPGEVGEVPISFQRMVDAKFAIVGTVDQVTRQIAELCEESNPDWFGWYLDQGLMDQSEILRQLEAFATKVLPTFA